MNGKPSGFGLSGELCGRVRPIIDAAPRVRLGRVHYKCAARLPSRYPNALRGERVVKKRLQVGRDVLRL